MDDGTAREITEEHYGGTLADPKVSKSVVRMKGFVGEPYEPLPIAPEPPAAWLVNRLATDEDGDPLMQGIFSNYNDDIILEADTNTIIGRYSPARGPAESLIIGEGLRIEDGVLIGEGSGGGEPGPPGPPGPQGPQGPMGPRWRIVIGVRLSRRYAGAGGRTIRVRESFAGITRRSKAATHALHRPPDAGQFRSDGDVQTAQFHDEDRSFRKRRSPRTIRNSPITGPAI